MRQLPLGVRLNDSAVFDTYFPGPNEEAMVFVRGVATGEADSGAWLWGPGGSGKTHLLQAACRAAESKALNAGYLPMDQLVRHGPEVLEGWQDRDLLAMDRIESIAGSPAFEAALFKLFNELHAAGGKLLIASQSAPTTLPVKLADLKSRLAWGVIYQLERLNDDQCVAALQLRARHRGLEMPDATARYLMRRLPRDIATLCDWLDRLDSASLAAQRRLTVPFVKVVLGAAAD